MAASSSSLGRLSLTQADALLADAVGRNSAAAIEVTAGTETVSHATRFLGMTGAPQPTLWLELSRDPQADGPGQLCAGGQVTIRFTSAKVVYQFDVTILESAGRLKLSGGQGVEAINVTRPAEVYRVQRRQSYRYELPAGQRPEVLLWPGAGLGPAKAARSPRSAFRARLINLSIDGMCVRLETGDKESVFNSGDAVAAQFTLDGQRSVEVEAAVRRVAPVGGAVDLGMEFTSLDRPPLGPRTREMLARWISEQQRRMLRTGRRT